MGINPLNYSRNFSKFNKEKEIKKRISHGKVRRYRNNRFNRTNIYRKTRNISR